MATNFSTPPVPNQLLVVSQFPLDGAISAAVGGDIVFSFDLAIQPGVGNITIKTGTGKLFAQYEVSTSKNLMFTGPVLRIDPSTEFLSGTEYQVEFDAGSIVSAVGNNYAGTTTYNFTTALAPNEAPNFTGFEGTGKFFVPWGSGLTIGSGNSVSVEADGKLLVVSTSPSYNSSFRVSRLNSDGSLDSSFIGAGNAVVTLSNGDDRGQSVVEQSDGKIVVAGTSTNTNSGNSELSLIRLNTDGSLDPSFTGTGKAIVPFGTGDDSGSSVAVQTDGKIVVAGTSIIDGKADFSLIRLNTDGSLDSSFNGSGKAIVPVGTGNDSGNDEALQTDGKIVVAGTSIIDGNADFSLIRLNTDGSLDMSFNGTGKAIVPLGAGNDYASSIAVQADGKIVVAGVSDKMFSLIRLNTDGSLDPNFNGNGKVIVQVGEGQDSLESIVIQSDGKIVAVGSCANGEKNVFAVLRLNSNGSPDNTFNGSGQVTIPIDSKVSYRGQYTGIGAVETRTITETAYSVVVQADGRIVLLGAQDEAYSGGGMHPQSSTSSKVALVRLNADGSLDTSFNGNPRTLGDQGSIAYHGIAPVALETSVAIFDRELASLNNVMGNYAGASITLARHGGASAEDVFSASGNLSFVADNAVLSGATIGTVTNAGGTLQISFNSNATQAAVNATLSSFLYANNASKPAGNVQIDWTFTDGNTGTQGGGGALSAIGSTKVNILLDISLSGTLSDDTFTSGPGNDTIDGMASLDTVNFAKNLALYKLVAISGTPNIQASGPDGIDTLTNIERLHFPDSNVAFDLNGNAGQIYRLYQAAFARTPDLAGLGNWIDAIDRGTSLLQIASAFMDSGEFNRLYGANPSDERFVRLLYLNALHRSPSLNELTGWTDPLRNLTLTRAQELVSFSESTENKEAVLPAIIEGISFVTTEQKVRHGLGWNFDGTDYADTIVGTAGNDIIPKSSGGNDTFYGGRGVDTVVLNGSQYSYYISSNFGTLQVINRNKGVTDTLIDVERVKFDDVTVAFDFSGNAGQVYRLYQAAFNRKPDIKGLSDWISAMDGDGGINDGFPLKKVAAGFIISAEFQTLYGTNPTNEVFVSQLYSNVLHRQPDQSGLTYWNDQLALGMSKEQALIGFSESPENVAALMGVMHYGIELNS